MLDTILRHLLLLIEPISLVWLGLLSLTVLLCWKRLWRFAAAAAAIALFLSIVGGSGVPEAMLRSLEREFSGVDVKTLPAADAVVMLGGCIDPSRYEVGGFHLTRAGDRVLMALEMMRLGKAPALVLGGGGAKLDGEIRVEGDLLRQWITDWRLLTSARQPPPEVISLGRCFDTHDEAVKFQVLARARGWKHILLVTSAAHMRRAAATFRTAGISVEPVPCNFLTTIGTSTKPRNLGIPRNGELEKASVWLHEKIGWMEYRRRGWISPVPAH